MRDDQRDECRSGCESLMIKSDWRKPGRRAGRCDRNDSVAVVTSVGNDCILEHHDK